MSKSTLSIAPLLLAALLAGCVGTGPNTQHGAVTGGALGAVAGAIIGNNSRGGDGLAGALIGGTIGAIAGGTVGNNADHQQGTVYGYPHRRTRYAVMENRLPPVPAPPMTEVIPPSPAPNALWLPGYWSYDGARYLWTQGRWEIPPPGVQTYVAAHWESRSSGAFVFVPGYWR
jgi:hypothetical protein